MDDAIRQKAVGERRADRVVGAAGRGVWANEKCGNLMGCRAVFEVLEAA